MSHSLALESAHWWETSRSAVGMQKEGPRDGDLPMIAYTWRLGLGYQTELGVRISPITGVDFKLNPVRTRYLDLALDPAVQTSVYPGEDWYGSLHLPLLAGINLSRALSLVGSVGYSYVLGNGQLFGWDQVMEPAVHMRGPLFRAGGGLDIRFSRSVALHPEVTYLYLYKGDMDPIRIVLFGVGVNWGKLPTYD